jgi:hypothetical protein
MATINLGSLKFNWTGAYNSSTSYAIDDVATANGNSYVCIQAHSNQAVGNATAYWNIMSSAGSNGSNGTDLTSTLTTRGDIVYKGASALTRLPKGTAGYYLKQGANDPEWGVVESGLTEVDAYRLTSAFSGTQNPITNWQRVNETHFSKIGTGLTESSGTWTFGATGVYQIIFDACLYISNTNVRYAMCAINATTNNSAYNTQCEQYTHLSNTGSTSYASISCHSIINCTNTSTHKFQLRCAFDNTGVHMEGGANESYTQVQAIRLGAAV